MNNIKIVIHGQPDCYFPGSTVKGEVVVTVEKPEEYHKIVVGISGQAVVCWTTGSGDNQRTYHGSVSYIKESSIVWSNKDISGDLAIGDHTYPFEYQLPADAPASFESYIGNVRYKIKAQAFLTGLFNGSIKSKVSIKVGDNTDHVSSCMEPKVAEMSKKVKFLCFDFGTVNVTCNLPQTGFSPGDSLPIDLHIENMTTKAVRIRASLHVVNMFTAGHAKRQSFNHFSVLMSPEFPPGAITSFEGSLQVPLDIQTTYRGCAIISVEYAVTLKAIAALGSSMDMNIPIVIAKQSSATAISKPYF